MAHFMDRAAGNCEPERFNARIKSFVLEERTKRRVRTIGSRQDAESIIKIYRAIFLLGKKSSDRINMPNIDEWDE
jgi:hypothetical protein